MTDVSPQNTIFGFTDRYNAIACPLFDGRWIVSDIGSRWHKTWKLFSSNALSISLLKGSLLWHSLYSEALCLEVVSRLVLWFSGSEVILQEGLQILKGGPLLGVPLPALEHELMQGAGAVLRAGHPVTTLYLLQDFPVVHAWGTNAKHVFFNWKKGALKFLCDAMLYFIRGAVVAQWLESQSLSTSRKWRWGSKWTVLSSTLINHN